MDAKVYLRSWKELDRKKNRLKEQIAELEQLLYPGGIDYSRDRVQSSPDETTSKIVAEIMELEKRLTEVTKSCEERRYAIVKAIQKIQDSRYSEMLYKRYIKRMKYEDIANEMHYSREHIIRTIHSKALMAFEEANADALTDE